MKKTCIICHKDFDVVPARQHKAKFCSVACKSEYQHRYIKGDNHPRWTDAERVKKCEYCGKEFAQGPTEAISTFSARKFCSHKCGWLGQEYKSGEKHPNWTGSPRQRDFQHTKWREAVIKRDKAVCQKCGATGIELHAHHIKAYMDHEELRYDINNGITLCCVCHWDEHSALIENGENCWDTLPDSAGGNQQPSLSRKALEGSTTNGRAYRRVETTCAYCGAFISRQLSQAKGKVNLFCNKKCMGASYSEHRTNTAMAVTPTRVPRP